MRSNIGRLLLVLAVVIGINFVLTNFLASLGAASIVILIVVCIAISFVITMFNYPRGYRKLALRDPNFHRAFVSESIFLIVLNLLLNFLF